METVVASDSYLKVHEQILNLELVLQCDDQLKRVTLELNMQEATDFLTKLQTIESEIVSASKPRQIVEAASE